MMEIMASERGGKVCTMDDRYCIDNGAMIAWPGLIQYLSNNEKGTDLKDSTFTQRFRTDEVEILNVIINNLMKMSSKLLVLTAAVFSMANASASDLIFTNSRALTGTTNYFAPNYDFEVMSLDKSQVLGLILGFITYGSFVIFAVVSLVRDAVWSSQVLADNIKSSIDLLKTKYNCDDKEIDQLLAEFEDKDAKLQAGIEDDDQDSKKLH